MGTTHLMVSLTITDAPTHGLPGHAGVGAGVVGLATNVQAVLVRIITPHRDVTERGLGQLPTFTADSLTIQAQGAALPAAVLIIEGIDSVRSAVTVILLHVVALIPALGSILLSVGAGVGVAGERAASPAVAPLALAAALVLSRLVHLSRAPGLRLKLHHYLLCV